MSFAREGFVDYAKVEVSPDCVDVIVSFIPFPAIRFERGRGATEERTVSIAILKVVCPTKYGNSAHLRRGEDKIISLITISIAQRSHAL